MSNFSIVKKICRQNILLRLIGAGALILLAVIMAFGLLPKTTRYLLARNNVFATPTNKYKVDKFYQGKTYSIYDWFAENDDGRFYLSPVADENGNEEFLIVYIPKRYEAKAERIMEQTWSYMETGDEDYLIEYISCRGMITTINTKTTQYVNEYEVEGLRYHVCYDPIEGSASQPVDPLSDPHHPSSVLRDRPDHLRVHQTLPEESQKQAGQREHDAERSRRGVQVSCDQRQEYLCQ